MWRTKKRYKGGAGLTLIHFGSHLSKLIERTCRVAGAGGRDKAVLVREEETGAGDVFTKGQRWRSGSTP